MVALPRRSRGAPEDPRYARMLSRVPEGPARTRYALRIVYLLQAALVWFVSLPVQAAQYLPHPPGALAWAGTALWVVGLFFEAVGDRQLARFKADPANRGRIMDRGCGAGPATPTTSAAPASGGACSCSSRTAPSAGRSSSARS